MDKGSSLKTVNALVVAGLLAAAPVLAATPDTDQLARRLVTAAAVKEGETVLVSGQARDAQLLEDIAVNVRKVGAFPLVTYESDRLAKRMFFDVPARYDTQTDAFGEKLAQVVDVMISVSNGQSEDLLAGADPKRLAARGKAGESIAQAMLKRNVRSVEVGNGFYPTPWRAKRYGMSEAALADAFWQAVDTDPGRLQARASQVKAALAAGDVLHITNPNGTDLTLRMKGRPVLASDGIISAEDIRAGGGAVAVYLPAGEVYAAPVPGSANGKVVHSHDFFRGKAVDNLTLQFKDGKLTSMTGTGPGYADLRAAYDAVDDPRKDRLGFVDLGINPDIKLPAGSQVGSWIPAGTVTVGIGGNTWAGGDNSVPYGLTAYLPGSTVTLDGKPIIERGQLKL
jgi:leucyl aminopeptidase (aminopeptidase T)